MLILIPVYLIQLVIVIWAVLIKERNWTSGRLMFPTQLSILLNLIPGFWILNMIYKFFIAAVIFKFFRVLFINIQQLPFK